LLASTERPVCEVCLDLTQNLTRRFGWGLGMQYVAKSDLSTGNTTFASHILKSNDLVCHQSHAIPTFFGAADLLSVVRARE